MNKPIISKETGRLLFELGIEILRTMKEIYELNQERSVNDEDTPEASSGAGKKDSNASDRDSNYQQTIK